MINAQTLLANPKIKAYVKALKQISNLPKQVCSYQHPIVQNAMSCCSRLTPIELVCVSCFLPYEDVKECYYVEALTSESLMFECCYLRCVLGEPPYEYAYKMGLSKNDIKAYQQKWLDAGIDSTKMARCWH